MPLLRRIETNHKHKKLLRLLLEEIPHSKNLRLHIDALIGDIIKAESITFSEEQRKEIDAISTRALLVLDVPFLDAHKNLLRKLLGKIADSESMRPQVDALIIDLIQMHSIDFTPDQLEELKAQSTRFLLPAAPYPKPRSSNADTTQEWQTLQQVELLQEICYELMDRLPRTFTIVG